MCLKGSRESLKNFKHKSDIMNDVIYKNESRSSGEDKTNQSSVGRLLRSSGEEPRKMDMKNVVWLSGSQSWLPLNILGKLL